MGQAQSKDVAEKLQHYSFEDLLRDDTFVSTLNESFGNLSADAQSRLHNVLTPRNTQVASTRLASAKLKPLLSVKEENIRLPPLVTTQRLNEWLTDSSRFFSCVASWGPQLESTYAPKPDMRDILSQRYRQMLNLQNRRSIDRLQWRFYNMFFYDLNVMLNGQNNLTARAANNILSTFSTIFGANQLPEIEQNLRSWVSRGRCYRNLSNALGGSGCLFLLPDSISDYLWEEALPSSGPAFDEACGLLQGFGIQSKAWESGAALLASMIEADLLAPFQWNVSTVSGSALVQGIEKGHSGA